MCVVVCITNWRAFLVFFSAVNGCVLISTFASLGGVLLRIVNSAVGLKICVITAGIKKYK